MRLIKYKIFSLVCHFYRYILDSLTLPVYLNITTLIEYNIMGRKMYMTILVTIK